MLRPRRDSVSLVRRVCTSATLLCVIVASAARLRWVRSAYVA